MNMAWCVGVLLLAAPASAAQLRLDFTLEPYPAPNVDPDVVVARVRSVSLLDERGKPQWTVPPPPAMASLVTHRPNAVAYLAQPDAPPERLGLFFVVHDKDVILYAQEHLLVFAARDGKLRFERAQGMSGFGSLSFQHAEATLECSNAKATRAVTNAPFLIACGDRVVLFFVQGFAVFSTTPWKALHTEMFPDVPQKWSYAVPGAKLTFKRLD